MALTPLEMFQAIEIEKKNITRLIVGSHDFPDIKIKSEKGKK